MAAGQVQGHLAFLSGAAGKHSLSQTVGRVCRMEPSQPNVAETWLLGAHLGHKEGKGRALQSVSYWCSPHWWGCPVVWVRTHFDPEEQCGTTRTRGQTSVSSLWFLLLRILSRGESQLAEKNYFKTTVFLFHMQVYYPTLL